MPELREYQEKDAAYLSRVRCSAIFNQQRTGKTPTSLEIVKRQALKKVLIICPASAMYQWKEEFELWLKRPCLVLDGTPKQRIKTLSQWTDGLILSYDMLKIKHRTNEDGVTSTAYGELPNIQKAKPDGVILDEAHRIKDYATATAKAVFKLIKTPNRIALTATPSPNRPYEIWAILHWLYPKLFSSYWAFINEFFGSESKINHMCGKTYRIENTVFKPGKDTKLQRFLSKMSTNRKRKDVMPWLPDKDYQLIRLPATPEQNKALEQLSKYYETEDGIVTQGTLDRLIRYRQLCLHPALLQHKGKSPKLEWVKQYLSDYPEKPVLIFSKFTSFLRLLYNEIKDNLAVGLIIGETSPENRNQIRKAFQAGRLQILLLQIDTCKEALTLDRAETAIFTDLYPPVGDIQQAEDRFIATSEERADKPHTIIQLVIKETYDEMLYQHIQNRASEIDVINNFAHYLRSYDNATT